MRRLLGSLAALALAACSGGGDDATKNLDSLDAELVEGQSTNASDPAVAGALQDPIMVDPGLASQANADAVRPPDRPYSAEVPQPDVAAGRTASTEGLMKAPPPVPGAKCQGCEAAADALTLGALAARQPDRRTAGCAKDLRYSASWANRLPADLPLYPDARVIEAAGTNSGKCALRVVSFWADVPMQTMLDWYYTRARKAGYSAEHRADGGEHVLGGARKRDGGAYILFMTERDGGGTNVDLVANNGV